MQAVTCYLLRNQPVIQSINCASTCVFIIAPIASLASLRNFSWKHRGGACCGDWAQWEVSTRTSESKMLCWCFLLLEHVLVPTLQNLGDSQKMWKTWPNCPGAFPTAMPNLCTKKIKESSRAEEKDNSLADGCENPCRTLTTNEPLADNILWYTIYLYTGIVSSVI